MLLDLLVLLRSVRKFRHVLHNRKHWVRVVEFTIDFPEIGMKSFPLVSRAICKQNNRRGGPQINYQSTGNSKTNHIKDFAPSTEQQPRVVLIYPEDDVHSSCNLQAPYAGAFHGR